MSTNQNIPALQGERRTKQATISEPSKSVDNSLQIQYYLQIQ